MNKLALILLIAILVSLECNAEENKRTQGWMDPWRDATVAIGRVMEVSVQQPNGSMAKKNIFAVVGTGVIFGLPDDPSGTPWLVTAKHIFYDPTKEPVWEPDYLQIRFSWFESKPIDQYLGLRIDIKANGKSLWLAHPNNDVDLACIPIKFTSKEVGKNTVSGITLANFATTDDIYEGAPIAVLGYPAAVGANFWTRAIVRQGIIAWASPIQPETQKILVDCNLFPGNSGGPVFKLATGTDREGNFAIGGRVAFLGIVSQREMEELPVKFGGKELIAQDDKGKSIPVISLNSLGIGVIEPASRVKELLIEASKR